jgi:hypothetical protein
MSPDQNCVSRLLRGDLSIAFYMSLLKLLCHLFLNISGGYGLFRDELYYIACAANPDIGYVDHPPLSVWILSAMITLFGDSLFVVRLVPAIASALSVFFTGLITISLGGKRFAVFFACLFSFSFINLAMAGVYSMNSLEILSWTVVAYVALLIVQEGKNQHWIVLGVVLGLGLLNKIGVLFLGAGIFVGMIATKERKWFATPWPYVAGAIAFIMFLPYVFWNIRNDLAHLEFIENASSEKYASLSPLSFLIGQILINNPIALAVWVPGLFALFFNKHLKQYKFLAFLFVIPFIILVLNGTSKAEYLAPAYAILWAAGCVWWGQMIQRSVYTRVAFGVLFTLWLALTIALTPMVLPVLPVEQYIAYAKQMDFEPESSEGKELAELPQFYADMFGWKEKAAGVAKVFDTLSEDEKAKCAIYSTNYGRCAAIDYYGKQYGLPKSIGGHNNYWIWGPRGFNGDVLIAIGGELEDHKKSFREVTQVSTIDCKYCMPYEDNVPVFLCRNLYRDINEIWPRVKHYE